MLVSTLVVEIVVQLLYILQCNPLYHPFSSPKLAFSRLYLIHSNHLSSLNCMKVYSLKTFDSMVIFPAVPPLGVTAHVNVVSAVLTAAVSDRVEVWVLVLYVPCATV